jgi:IMP dehydrogenase
MKIVKGYSFDDVLLVPKKSDIPSRNLPLDVKLPKGFSVKIPIVSANMKTVTEVFMAQSIARQGGMALLHRFDTTKNLLKNYLDSILAFSRDIESRQNIGVSLGIKDEDMSLAKEYIDLGCKLFCVDVAHGHHTMVISFIEKLRSNYPDILIIAGNVATPEGAKDLWNAGADIIKIGVGPGSICSTRVETGNGYPQLSALDLICNTYYNPRNDEQPMFIADGGIRFAGDCVKSLCFADLVMIGNLFAGTDESPGKVVSFHDKKYKEYAGSSTHKSSRVEGVVGLVPYRGSVEGIIKKLCEGIQSGMSYQGAHTLKELKLNPEWVEISGSGLIESHPHDILR